MNVAVYYRNPMNDLKRIDATDIDCPLDARHEVMNLLKIQEEIYIRPVLALVTGGKQ